MKKFIHRINEKIDFILKNITSDELFRIMFIYFIYVFSFCIFYSIWDLYIISNVCSILTTLFLSFDIFIDTYDEYKEKQVFTFPELIGIILGFISMIPMIFNNI